MAKKEKDEEQKSKKEIDMTSELADHFMKIHDEEIVNKLLNISENVLITKYRFTSRQTARFKSFVRNEFAGKPRYRKTSVKKKAKRPPQKLVRPSTNEK